MKSGLHYSNRNQGQEDQEGLKLKETHQFLIYINNNYSQRKNLNPIRKTQTQKISYSKYLGPEVNADNT